MARVVHPTPSVTGIIPFKDHVGQCGAALTLGKLVIIAIHPAAAGVSIVPYEGHIGQRGIALALVAAIVEYPAAAA